MIPEKAGFVKGQELEERVYHIKRVSKKVTGGNAIGFTALAIVGNKKGKVVIKTINGWDDRRKKYGDGCKPSAIMGHK